MDYVNQLYQEYGPQVLQIVTFLVSFLVLYGVAWGLIQPFFNRLLERAKIDDHARKPLLKISWLVLLLGVVAGAFGVAGFGNFLTSLATIAAAGTLAIGFAMQDVIKNFVSGVFIFIERPFRIGDWIEWDGYAGIVMDIELRVTRVRTFDNELLTVPNNSLTDGVLKNPVAHDRLRIKVPFGIGYDDDIGKAMEIIVEEAENHEGILEDPAPSVRLTDLADSYVGLQSRLWIEDPGRSDFIKTRSDYVRAVKKRFDEEGIEIPYPQRDLSGEMELQGQEPAPASD